jgi:hypothetical protein
MRLQCYKAVPALCVHVMKKTPAKGAGRLHVLRVLDAIVGRSLSKYGNSDRYGTPMFAHAASSPS